MCLIDYDDVQCTSLNKIYVLFSSFIVLMDSINNTGKGVFVFVCVCVCVCCY